ncbi:MAG: hypothetical protein ACOCP4_04705 [Candidatus Woesearchaeota archaeon]
MNETNNERIAIALERIADKLDVFVGIVEKEEFYVRGDINAFDASK